MALYMDSTVTTFNICRHSFIYAERWQSDNYSYVSLYPNFHTHLLSTFSLHTKGN